MPLLHVCLHIQTNYAAFLMTLSILMHINAYKCIKNCHEYN